MKELVVNVEHFRKTYGDYIAVDDLSFQVHKSEIFGLLGPNGSGKTSTLETLEGIRKRDGGNISILGMDPEHDQRKLMQRVGIQLQTSGLPATMTAREAMRFFCAYHGTQPRFDLMERLNLGGKMDAQYASLSTGQQRRLVLALAIAHQPDIIFLDEPTAGLDVASRAELHKLMFELKEEGHTLILATHDMAEAEKMTDRIAILLNGNIVVQGTAQQITATGSGTTRISVQTEMGVLSRNHVGFPGVLKHKSLDGYDIFFTTETGPSVSAILQYINLQSDRLVDLRVERPSLEERFLEITQQ